MIHTAWRVFLYALVAATSPLALTSTLFVLRSGRPRINGLLYAGGFLATQTFVLLLALAVGVASVTHGDRHPGFEYGVTLLFGALLVVAAFYLRAHPRAHATKSGPNKATAVLGRIKHLSPGQALGVGAALGIGGPKRITVTLLVAAAIAASGLGFVSSATIAIEYIVIGTVLVWLPVVLYVFAGKRAEEWIATAQAWASEHEQTLTFYPALIVGIVLVVDGLVELLT
jgi:Sap-like sulfolipid-1-addressing protein